MTRTAAETGSFARATIVMDESVGIRVSAKTIERVVHDVSQELTERRDTDPRSDDALAPRCECPRNWQLSNAMAVAFERVNPAMA